MMNGFRNFQSNLISNDQYSQIVQAGQAKMNAADTASQSPQQTNAPAKPAPAKPQGGHWTGPKIDPIFQTMLGVNPDGKLGRITQSALDIYKKSRNPGMSNELAFEYLKREPQYKAKMPLPYDDNSNTYGSTANQIVRENPF